MAYQIAILTGHGSDARRISTNLLEGRDLKPVWCEYDIGEVAAAKEKTDIFLLFLPEEKNAVLRQVCFYLRDVCIDEEKTVYLFGNKEMLAFARGIIPGLMISGMFVRGETEIAGVIAGIAQDINNRGANLKSVLILDDGETYFRDLSIILRERFQTTIAKPDIDNIIRALAGTDIFIMSVDMKLTVMEQAMLFAAVELQQKRGRLKLIFVADKREEQNRVNLIKADSILCLSKETPVEKAGAYLMKNYS